MRIAALAALALTLIAPAARALDERLYTTILAEHTVAVDVIASTRVDYDTLRTSKAWGTLLRNLHGSDPSCLRARKREPRLLDQRLQTSSRYLVRRVGA